MKILRAGEGGVEVLVGETLSVHDRTFYYNGVTRDGVYFQRLTENGLVVTMVYQKGGEMENQVRFPQVPGRILIERLTRDSIVLGYDLKKIEEREMVRKERELVRSAHI